MKLIELYKNNKSIIKIILIGLLVVFLISSGVMNYFQDKKTEELKYETEKLENENNDLGINIKNITDQYKLAQERINELQRISDSLKQEAALKTAEIDSINILHENEIAELKTIPADTVYKKLFVYYPKGDNPLLYPFSEPQIRSMLEAAINLDYYIDQTQIMRGKIHDLSENISIKSSIIVNKDYQIGKLNQTIKMNVTYTNNLESLKNNYQKSYKKERFGKKIWQGVSAAEFLYILYQGFRK